MQEPYREVTLEKLGKATLWSHSWQRNRRSHVHSGIKADRALVPAARLHLTDAGMGAAGVEPEKGIDGPNNGWYLVYKRIAQRVNAR